MLRMDFARCVVPTLPSAGSDNNLLMSFSLSQVAVSIMRAIGPATANSLFSYSISHNFLGGYFVYYVLMLIVGVALVVASMLPSAL